MVREAAQGIRQLCDESMTSHRGPPVHIARGPIWQAEFERSSMVPAKRANVSIGPGVPQTGAGFSDSEAAPAQLLSFNATVSTSALIAFGNDNFMAFMPIYKSVFFLTTSRYTSLAMHGDKRHTGP